MPALLAASHIADPALSARITAAVNLILTTVNSFAGLIPQPAGAATAKKVTHKPTMVPRAADLKKQWNQQVCSPSGDSSFDSIRPICELN